jgi:hypothetical protein
MTVALHIKKIDNLKNCQLIMNEIEKPKQDFNKLLSLSNSIARTYVGLLKN